MKKTSYYDPVFRPVSCLKGCQRVFLLRENMGDEKRLKTNEAWKVDIEKLDYHHYLPIFFDGPGFGGEFFTTDALWKG